MQIDRNGGRGAPLWRHILIAMIPVTAVAGPYLFPLPVGGITIYAYRILLLAAVPVLWLVERGNILGERWFLRAGFGCGGLWVAWGLVSLTWAHDTKAAVVDIVAVALGWLAVFVVVQCVEGSATLLRSLRRGWIVAFVVAVAVAAWELRTGRHLESSFSDQLGTGSIGSLVVISTFANPNNFAAFLLMVVPVILWEASDTRNWFGKLALLSCLPLAAGLTIFAGARLAMIGFLFEVAVLGATLGLRPGFRGRLLLGIGAVFVAVGALLVKVPAAAHDVASLWTLTDELQYSGSASIRLSMMESGMLMVERTYGAGVGAGNFPDAIRRGVSIGYTGGIVNPHNLGIEIVAQYGLLVAAAFCAFVFMLMTRAIIGWSRARRQRDRDREVYMALLVSVLVGYLFAAGENSAYINQPVHWAMLGTIVAMLTVGGRSAASESRIRPSDLTGDSL